MKSINLDSFVTKMTELPQIFIRKLGISLDEDLLKMGLEMVHIMIINLIGKSEEKPMISEIGKRLIISNAKMTYIIDEMESKKLLERKRIDKDRRIVRLSLTKKGEEVMKKDEDRIKHQMKLFLQSLNEKERDRFVKAIETIYSVLKKYKGIEK
mgnify:CR=1 FL=1